MRLCLFPALAVISAIALFGPVAAAEDQPPAAPPAAEQPAASLTPEQLDQLTAPIALYPDPLIAQILMAATYPLEVVEAHRWLQQPGNAALSGDQLAQALAQQRWDPSVKSLVAFPHILRMMDTNLTWTEQLGDAFLAGQPAVMDSVQRLRQKAEAAGKLRSTPQQVVTKDDGQIAIEPPEPDRVYVPVYDPNVAYGAWPYPDYPPAYFPDFFPEVTIGPLGFGFFPVVIIQPLFIVARIDFRHNRIVLNIARFNALNFPLPPIALGAAWQHDPRHRAGVSSRDPAVRASFASSATAERFQGSSAPAAIAAPAPRHWSTSSVTPLAAASMTRLPALQTTRAPLVVSGRAPAVLRQAAPVVRSFGGGVALRAPVQVGHSGPAFAPAQIHMSRPAAAAPRAAASGARAMGLR